MKETEAGGWGLLCQCGHLVLVGEEKANTGVTKLRLKLLS